jgi:hypothetical protein
MIEHAALDEMKMYKKFWSGSPSEGKRPLARNRRKREDNIKVDLEDIGCEDREKWRFLWRK